MVDPSLICMHCMSVLPRTGVVCPACGAHAEELENETNQLPVGSILAGKYLVGCVLGQGGFGITYIGWDLNLGIKLAIKEYYPEGLVGRDSKTQSTVIPLKGEKGAYFLRGRDKFVEEARTLAKFSGDPGIVSVHDFFNENGTAYIVMDFVEGKTLKQIAEERNGKLSFKETLRYLLPVMDSLGNVHQAGLLHRDISPDNIIVTPEGRAVLLDFGAARRISAMGEHSNTINVKHGYAPEEQYRTRGEQGPWTDVYALCATIYRLTTGRTPTPAPDRVMSDSPLPPPNALGADLTLAQQAAIMKGLAIRGQNRQQSMRELKDQLIPAAKESVTAATVSANRSSPEQPTKAQLAISMERSKTRVAWVPLLISVFLIICILVLLWIKKNPDLIGGSNDSSITKAEKASTQEPDTIVWDDPFLEAGIRKALGKSDDEAITRADTSEITALAVLGDSVVINDSELAAELQFAFNGVFLPDSQTPIEIPERTVSLNDLAYFPNLKSLTLVVSGVEGFEGLENCTKLENLALHGAGSADLAPIALMHDLRSLYVEGNTLDYYDLEVIGTLTNLEHLSIPDYYGETDITPLGQLLKLKTLNLSGAKVTSIEPLSNLTQLKELDLSYTTVTDFFAISGLSNLETLNLATTEIVDLSSLTNLVQLRFLDLNCNSIRDLTPLESLNNIEVLDLSGCTFLNDIQALSGITSLRKLNLDSVSITDIKPLSALDNLEQLDLSNTIVNNLTPLKDKTSLETLLLLYNFDLRDLSPLKNVTSLKVLDFSDTNVSDLSPLKKLSSLERLAFFDTKVDDLSPLVSLVSLRALDFNSTSISDLSPLQYLINLETLIMSFTNVSDVAPLAGLPLKYIEADDSLQQKLREMFPNADIG